MPLRKATNWSIHSGTEMCVTPTTNRRKPRKDLDGIVSVAANPSPSAGGSWLPDMDLNHDKQIQSLLCYRYTIGQTNPVSLGALRAESSL